MRWNFALVELLLALTAGLTHASHYSRDESSEDTNTEFNLASTFKGGISSNRHHARAQLNSQLYPDLRQQSGGSPDIDAPSAHESGGSGVGTLDVRAVPYGLSVPPQQPLGYPNYPAQPVAGQPPFVFPAAISPPQSPPAACGRPAAGASPNAVSNGCQQPTSGQAQPSFGYPPNPNPQAGDPSGVSPAGVYPSYFPQQPPSFPPPQPFYPYPGQYLPQYPSYPPYPHYPNYGPGVAPASGAPGLTGSAPQVQHPGAPPTSYQNQHNYAPHATPGQHNHYDRSFKMKTEYTEDGVHKGPFDVLNNHGSQGYGSGFGGGYNGAFGRPGY